MADQEKELLRERLDEYEKLLEEVTGKAKSIGIITAGPFQDNGMNFYRVSVGGTQMVLVHSESDAKSLVLQQEVIVTETAITKALPTPLQIVRDVPKFKHISWNEVGGLSSQIEEIRNAIELPLKNSKEFEKMGIKPLSGALLYGPPGCGKTLISRVIASSIIDASNSHPDSFQYVKGPEILNKFVGETEAIIRELFSRARAATRKTGSRSVLFIDEADAILSSRTSNRGFTGMSTTVVPQFLSEMDGFDTDSPFVLLSTNMPDALDPAIVRDQRIDMKIKIDRPTREDAAQIFGIHLKKMKTSGKQEEIASKAAQELYNVPGLPYSGAMIETIVHRAATRAFPKAISMDHIIGSINTTASENIMSVA